MNGSRGFGVAAGLDSDVARGLAERCAALGYTSMWSNDHPGALGLETLLHFALDLRVALRFAHRLLARSSKR